MSNTLFGVLSILIILIFLISGWTSARKPSVLLITGGHSYDTIAFTGLFTQMKGIKADTMMQPRANQAIAAGLADRYDVIVFYDMWQTVTDAEKEGYIRLCRMGKPLIFLHHALVSYQEWPEFEKIRGGKYYENRKILQYPQALLSTYRHDVTVGIQIAARDHPVTRGLHDFTLFDEVYGNYGVAEDVEPLLTTRHPESSRIVAWENHYLNSDILYIQPGHDKHSFNDPVYRRLIRQALLYSAGKNR